METLTIKSRYTQRKTWGIRPTERVKGSKKAYTRERVNVRDLWTDEDENERIEEKYPDNY